MIKWLRQSLSGRIVTTIIRVYLGYLWLTSGIAKLHGFTAQAFIKNGIKNPVVGPDGQPVYGWFTEILKNFVMPNINLVDFLVVWGEIFIGLGLILGAFATTAVFFALLMNFSYLLAGAISVNPQYIFLELIILVAGFNASKLGLDYFIIPFLRKKIPFLEKTVDN
ncbi:hypothetical protein FC19_GL000412 [Liquorilactobacillus aquaticus DSM 21051]|uniref:DoxX family protein n=1 Tax=Liquorilactobacillus aquaticus DSM 21051 TaxID=1423725 RepID=A0A0R2CZK7_9LACO|nr:DoxX family membrane protein [Liquorilactobacillus aquaticus]KRM96885.1 hypothetical protein FC19_GL000412 [Liquorilactobacillus aquaticus DSM 21051]